MGYVVSEAVHLGSGVKVFLSWTFQDFQSLYARLAGAGFGVVEGLGVYIKA